MSLLAAWGQCKASMVKQVQGDCGLFSFWYATVLLRQLSPQGRPVVYPRKHPEPQATGKSWPGGAVVGESIRAYAKSPAIRSGQGEILTSAEMEKIITHFGYKATASNAKGALRKAFITRSLSANQPVMFPYTKGNAGPVNALTAVGVAGSDYGSHWSLIIGEDSGNYKYLDPHNPATLQEFPKDTVLESNQNVDHQVYVRFWGKEDVHYTDGSVQYSSIDPIGNVLTSSNSSGYLRTYDIGQGGRTQKLANVLITVY